MAEVGADTALVYRQLLICTSFRNKNFSRFTDGIMFSMEQVYEENESRVRTFYACWCWPFCFFCSFSACRMATTGRQSRTIRAAIPAADV